MKRYLCFFIIAAFICFNCFFEKVDAIPTKHVAAPYINARSAIAMDSKSKIVIFEKDSRLLIPMASTTKIVTALVAIKYGNLDKMVEISSTASSIRGSRVGYRKGDKVSIKELIYGLMLRSGNDAAIALAEGIAGSVGEFCRLMNEFGNQIGLLDTHFESPHGLDSENHYTTAYDLSIATAVAKQNPLFNEIVSSKDVEESTNNFTRNFHNINKILWQIPEANGVKTGYTGQAGKCLVSSINYQGNDIIIVILNSSERWKETKKIYDYLCSQYEYKKVLDKNEMVYSGKIKNSNCNINLKCNEDIILPVKKSCLITKKVVVPEILPKSIQINQNIGVIEIYQDNKKIYSCLLKNQSNVNRENKVKNWFPFIK